MFFYRKNMIKYLEKNPYISFIFAILMAFLIFYVSSMTFEHGTPGPDWEIKSVLYHYIVFFLFCFFLSISLIKGKNLNLLLPILLICLFYAITDEIHQIFVPNRACDIFDFLIDSMGIFSSELLYLSNIYLRRKY
jgi:VanZ family protein